ncbi:MAG TPA: hypothetical protein VF846_03630 [Thermoanaerobaculia bacterium]
MIMFRSRAALLLAIGLFSTSLFAASPVGTDATCPATSGTVTAWVDEPVCRGVAPKLHVRLDPPDPTAVASWSSNVNKWFPRDGWDVEGRPDVDGHYSVTVRTATCEFAPVGVDVDVDDLPIATGLPPSTCGPTRNTVTLQNGPFSNIVWEVDGGTIVSGQGTNAVTLDTPDQPLAGGEARQVRVYVSGTSADGCVYTHEQVEAMVVYGAYNLPISGPSTACAGVPQNATASAPAGGTYQWSITNGTITASNGGNVTYELNGAGPAVLSVAWSSGTQCASGQKTINLGSTSSLTINTPSTACPGVTQSASIDGNPSGTYQWSITNGQILSSSGSSATYQINGNGNAVLSVTSTGSGCAASGQRTIAPGGTTTVSINTPSTACPGIEQTASVNGNPSGTYLWSITNGTITENNGNNIRYTVNGNATLNVSIDSTSGCDATGQASIAATGPTATVPTRNDDVCAGETYAIPVTLSGTAPFTVTWSDGHVDSNITAHSYSRVVSPESSTTYRITAVHDANCSGNVSGDVELTVGGAAPEITDQPDDTQVAPGQSATLTVGFNPSGATVQWYRGSRGDRSNPVQGATSPTLRTPPLETTTRFWAQVRTTCGTTLSSSATVTMTGTAPTKRRSVRH